MGDGLFASVSMTMTHSGFDGGCYGEVFVRSEDYLLYPILLWGEKKNNHVMKCEGKLIFFEDINIAWENIVKMWDLKSQNLIFF